MISRRGFLKSILAAGVAPAFIGSSILMPLHAIAQPEYAGSLDATVARELADDTFLTPQMITAEAIRILENNLTLSRLISATRRTAEGDVPMRIRKPLRYFE